MKKNIVMLFLSLLMCISLVLPPDLSISSKVYAAENLEKDADGNYVIYVSLAGNDSESNTMGTYENPLKTINAAIGLINRLGLGENDTATVKIITTTESDEWGETGYVTYQNTASHTATIVYTSADPAEKAYLSCYGEKGNMSNSLWVHGPSVFKNLKLIDQRADSPRGAYLQGHDVVFEDLEHYYLKTDEAGTLRTKKVSIFMFTNRNGNGSVGAGGRFELYDGSSASEVVMGGLKDSSGGKDPSEDVTFVLNGGTLPKLTLTSSAEGHNTVFGKNVNIIINNASVTSINSNQKGETTAPPLINGAFQLISNNSTYGSLSLVATGSDGEDAKQYIITSESDTGSLDVTADAGTYKVLGGGYAYITDTAEEKVYYGNETISVPKAGVWAVSYADTLEDVINEVKAKFSVTDVYDNGRGTISIEIPKYKHVMKITDAGLRESTGNFESNPNMEYLSENTELFGKTVRRIVRNPEIGDEAAASCRPLIFKHSAILDENGNKIPVGDVRYITINYYFESPEENPSLEGLAMEWTQGRYLDSAGAGDYVGNTASSLDYAGEAPNTIKANSWSTVTID